MPEPAQTDSILEAVKNHSRRSAKNLLDILNRYRGKTGAAPAPSSAAPVMKREPKSGSFLTFLQIVPYVLAALFLVSLFWDFNGLKATLLGHVFNFQGLLRILSVSGLIGFLTNWLAITMLFKPAQKRPLLGQGLIPAQKNRIANRLAQAVSDDLINPEIIKQKIRNSNLISIYRKRSTVYIKNIIDDPSFRSELKQLMVQYIDDMVGDPDIRGAIAQKILVQLEQSLDENSIEHVALRAYSFIKGDKMQQIVEESLHRIPDSIESGLAKFDDFLDDLPHRINENSDIIEQWVTTALYKLINQLDVQGLVEDNLQQYDEQHLSDVILKATNEQLRYIQYLGGILGVIGGLVIWEAFYSLITLAIVILFIFILDNILVRFR